MSYRVIVQRIINGVLTFEKIMIHDLKEAYSRARHHHEKHRTFVKITDNRDRVIDTFGSINDNGYSAY